MTTSLRSTLPRYCSMEAGGLLEVRPALQKEREELNRYTRGKGGKSRAAPCRREGPRKVKSSAPSKELRTAVAGRKARSRPAVIAFLPLLRTRQRQKRVLHLFGAAGTNRRVEEGEGATSPFPLLFMDYPSIHCPVSVCPKARPPGL
ncbi:hypothetical protein Tco_0890988 [Tanacetum coccineum]|uniref:Uncharacterized protein n=1 Tax=Tanacetum coccineum TaxID=301880 RepID=A0ABQ5C1L4_9ASTR